MWLRLVLVAVLFITTAECVDKARLAKVPQPQKNFVIEKYIGNWYLQYRYTPCSWSGSTFFTDFITQFELKRNRNVLLKDNFRSTFCIAAPYEMFPREPPGIYTLKDSLGDLVTGDCIMVATDYTSFGIEWGCTKPAIDGTCADTYVIVKTRKKKPSAYTLGIVKQIIFKLWSLTFEEMQCVSHENSCIRLPETSRYNYLKKEY